MYFIFMTMVAVILLIMSYKDIRTKRVNILLLAILGIVCGGSLFFKQDFGFMDAVGGLMTGLCVIGVSMLTKGEIGAGDGIVIAFLGLMTGFKDSLVVVCMASFLMAVVSVLVIVTKKGNKKTKLPFIPALTLSYVLWIFGG